MRSHLNLNSKQSSFRQNVPGYRADRSRPRTHPAPRGPLLLRPEGQRGQADELSARVAVTLRERVRVCCVSSLVRTQSS